MDRIWIDEQPQQHQQQQEQQHMQIDGNDYVAHDKGNDNKLDDDDGDGETPLTIDSFFKLRLLNDMMNNNKHYQQKSLSVSGNRNLACCCDSSHCRITTFEMDICEDDDDDDIFKIKISNNNNNNNNFRI
nr:bromodomain-containing protein DDB_G0280777-like [Dermatophagoides farinae]